MLTSAVISNTYLAVLDLIVVLEIVEAALRITTDPLAFVLLLKLEPLISTPEPASIAVVEDVIVTLVILATEDSFV